MLSFHVYSRHLHNCSFYKSDKKFHDEILFRRTYCWNYRFLKTLIISLIFIESSHSDVNRKACDWRIIIFIYSTVICNFCFTIEDLVAILFYFFAEVFEKEPFFPRCIAKCTFREEIKFQRSRTYVPDKKGRLSRSARARNSDKSIRQYRRGRWEGMEGRGEFLRSRYHPVCFVEGSD